MSTAAPRTRLLEAALRLLASHGPSEIKARSVSSEAGLSTMGVYTHFGGVSELLQAIADEGFSQQLTMFRQVANTADPMTDLCAMALACRDFAQGNSHLYDLMFGLSIQGRYSPARGTLITEPKEGSAAFQASYSYLRGECLRMADGKGLRKIDPDLMATQLWSALHGFIMLELGGYFTEVESPSASILMPMCVNLIVGLGADRKRAEASAALAIADWGSRQKRPAKPALKALRKAASISGI
jgi:AcrR family transcriptional regulator